MATQALNITGYRPTSPRTGEGGALFRMKNFIIRGGDAGRYAEIYAGSENLSETIASSAITGTVTLTNGSKTVAGAGTTFVTELRPGQFLLVHDSGNSKSYPLVIDEIASATSLTVTRAPTVAVGGAGLTAYRLPVLFEMGRKRGTLIHGNALEFDKGTIIGVGDGTLRRNGSALAGTSMAFTSRRPKIAVYDPTTGNYSVYTIGMATPAVHTLAAAAGGTKNMQGGDYSILLVPARQATKGYNNPSPKPTKVTITTGQRVQITFVAMDTANGQDSWRYYVTRFNNGVSQAENGPWYYGGTITSTDLGGTGAGTTYNVEWLDHEVEGNEKITYNNDAPGDAEYVASLAGYPIYVSCQGQGHSAATTGTSPGPGIVPAKPNNVEAAPLASQTAGVPNIVFLSPPENILGFVAALGRLYLLTPNRLQIAQFTGNAVFPVAARPFWVAGFKNAYQLVFVNDTLYGFAGASPTRSRAEGDEGGEDKSFAADVQELVRDWNPGHVLVGYDPKNDAVCFFHSGHELNSSGYWTTRVLMYGLKERDWIGDVTLESTTQDMVVSGVATVGTNLEFLAGGRTSGGTVSIGTYRFDTGSGSNVSGYLAWEFWDGGSEDRDKCVRSFQATGVFASSTYGIHGAAASEAIDVTVLEAGNSGSKSGSISITNASSVTRTANPPINVPGLAVFTGRVDFTWTGSGNKCRLDEAFVDYVVQGTRR